MEKNIIRELRNIKQTYLLDSADQSKSRVKCRKLMQDRYWLISENNSASQQRNGQ